MLRFTPTHNFSGTIIYEEFEKCCFRIAPILGKRKVDKRSKYFGPGENSGDKHGFTSSPVQERDDQWFGEAVVAAGTQSDASLRLGMSLGEH